MRRPLEWGDGGWVSWYQCRVGRDFSNLSSCVVLLENCVAVFGRLDLWVVDVRRGLLASSSEGASFGYWRFYGSGCWLMSRLMFFGYEALCVSNWCGWILVNASSGFNLLSLILFPPASLINIPGAYFDLRRANPNFPVGISDMLIAWRKSRNPPIIISLTLNWPEQWFMALMATRFVEHCSCKVWMIYIFFSFFCSHSHTDGYSIRFTAVQPHGLASKSMETETQSLSQLSMAVTFWVFSISELFMSSYIDS